MVTGFRELMNLCSGGGVLWAYSLFMLVEVCLNGYRFKSFWSSAVPRYLSGELASVFLGFRVCFCACVRLLFPSSSFRYCRVSCVLFVLGVGFSGFG